MRAPASIRRGLHIADRLRGSVPQLLYRRSRQAFQPFVRSPAPALRATELGPARAKLRVLAPPSTCRFVSSPRHHSSIGIRASLSLTLVQTAPPIINTD